MSARNEQALVGALLVYPDAIAEVVSVVEVEDFTSARAATVYAAMRRLLAEGLAVDFVTVSDELHRAGSLLAVGTDWLTAVASCAPSGLHYRDYARLVARDGAERRGQTERLPFKGAVRV